MRNLAILLFLTLIITSCDVSNYILSPQLNDIKLTISTPRDTIYDFAIINVSIENNTIDDLYLLDKRFCDISRPKATKWNFEIFFQDTIRMITPMLINHGGRRKTKENYVLIKSGDKYNFYFSVDFGDLLPSSRYMASQSNNDFGEYSMKLSYHDCLRYYMKAFQGRIESNVITVVYKP